MVSHAYKFDIPIHKPWFELTDKQKALVWEGNNFFYGINHFFKKLEEKSYKIQNRVLLSRYRGKTTCTECNGKRLRKEADYVKIGDKTISDLVTLPLDELSVFFSTLKLNKYEEKIGKRLLSEINNRLDFLKNVGLTYLTLNRTSNTLSGGESQRINLATSLGSSLVGSMYILDEPSIGLHPKDTEQLIKVLKQLRNLGNTVIVVEHDEDIMKAADYIIDIGPEAGTHGGHIAAEGTYKDILKSDSLTSKYLSEELQISVPKIRRVSENFIQITGARENNLKNINVRFPLDSLTVITGVSGSGKSTLVKKILYPLMQKKIIGYGEKIGQHTEMNGSFDHIKHVEFIDQNPIGKSSRSNPVTYVKAFDEIRELFSRQKLSKTRGYKPGFFSFNVQGGRCEECEGEGTITVGMQCMADVHLECETCKGKRYKTETLDILYKNKTIQDILEMSLDDALLFFNENPERLELKILQKITPLVDVGLGYLKLGQSSSTMSGGEAQRIKLASFLAKGNKLGATLFIFDEPTTGLHFHDIEKLIIAFNALILQGHSILVIEHNTEVLKCADHIIDLGPEGGENGGMVVASGTPESIVKDKNSLTGKFLKSLL